jgi:FtsP/CotA-like multicopper oxidase with cupredoxin domain
MLVELTPLSMPIFGRLAAIDVVLLGWFALVVVSVAYVAYAFNGQVPGPRIRVTEGDQVRFNVTNRLPETTTVHWHGLILPNLMDGPAEVTQEPIEPGQTYAYEFVARQPGTFFYHSHDNPDRQQALGLYGALIVDPRDRSAEPAYDQELVVQLQEWLFRDGYTFPAMPMEGSMPNYFTINGKAYPATETVSLRVGERLRVRFIGSSNGFIHPMHIHGGPFTIFETDGHRAPPGVSSSRTP